MLHPAAPKKEREYNITFRNKPRSEMGENKCALEMVMSYE
jgi:hypothetical protein